ncbi:hypothetical protein R0135_00665 [Congregibacter variabilis]|uniref:DUF4439 domain-containing protein n=1 Tax=Congregibacter variabilis TaxID=3081200 RepID=A0ABZ0I3D7_9GAMM|nr:hypothetical protein R0135_00665 [Congregibacter sp. IMCC43200]
MAVLSEANKRVSKSMAANVLAVFTVVVVSLGASASYAQLGGFGKKLSGMLGNDDQVEEPVEESQGDAADVSATVTDEAGAAAVPMDALSMQDALVVNYLSAAALINQSQILLADAFGLKDEAAELRAQSEVLSGGTVLDKDALETASEVSERANEAIAKKLAEGEDLTDDAKQIYASAFGPYLKGLALTAGLSDDFGSFGNAAKNRLVSAPMMQKLSVKKELAAGTYILTSVPGFTKDLYDTSKSLLSFASAQSIPVPDDATDALESLDFGF